jgi:signal transduction histidine kinase
MSGFTEGVDESGLAAGRIAADPVFSALESSGAPILAVSDDPLRITHLNAAARAVFGDDAGRLADLLFRSNEPGARRLSELVESIRHGAALRLERLRFELGEAPQTVTVLCRRLSDDSGPSSFVLAALGVRPEEAPAGESSSVSSASAALRETLALRHGARARRFLWKTDADRRFVDVTHVLADVVGAAGADILGRSVDEVTKTLALDGSFARALASGKSWSGIEIDWPLEGGGRVPVMLGALPTRDADRRFAGYQGYGVIRLDRAYVGGRVEAAAPAPSQAPPPAEIKAPQPAPAEPPRGEAVEERSTAKVVPLRAQHAGPKPEGSDERALNTNERSAFEEIARALREGGLVAAEERREESPGAAAPEGRALPAQPRDSEFEEALNRLPVGVLIARGSETLFANRTLLDYLGYQDCAALDADGGLARLFFGRAPTEIDGHAGSVAVQASNGEALDVDAHLQVVDWAGEAATMLTLRRSHSRPARGPEATALGLARTLEEKLARARADNSSLRAVIEASGAAIAVVGEDGRIAGATASFAALFGEEKGALALSARITRLRLDEEAAIRVAARGRRLNLEASLKLLAAGGARNLCVVLREPQSPRRADELEAAREAAERASAAKSDFLARVSHEIRTPLNAIIGFAEVMMEERFGPIGSERYKDYLKDVHASGAHVLSLVNDLLDLSKIEAGKLELSLERVDANAIIAESVAMMQTQSNQSRVVIRLALAERLPLIRADARSLKQILLNVLSNAVKFNEPGGQVIVSTALTDAGFVVIRVKDTGVGMSDDEIATALEPFKQIATSRQISQKQRGTGLGLPLTKALIEANHASFTIKSRKGEGTLIEIAFPPPQVLAAE